MLCEEMSYGVILLKIFNQYPKLEPCSFTVCKELVLCAEVDTVSPKK